MRFTDVGGRVIASDYRGPVAVIFFIFPTECLRLIKVVDSHK